MAVPRAAAAEVVHACAGFALLELVISVALVPVRVVDMCILYGFMWFSMIL